MLRRGELTFHKTREKKAHKLELEDSCRVRKGKGLMKWKTSLTTISLVEVGRGGGTDYRQQHWKGEEVLENTLSMKNRLGGSRQINHHQPKLAQTVKHTNGEIGLNSRS